jgi:hypothetical protein
MLAARRSKRYTSRLQQESRMAATPHPAASHHLPSFITAPGETDVLMVVMVFFLIFVVVIFGVLYFRLHSLPETVAHKSHKIQYEIVAILGLISLFTHMHIFWIIGLLLAFIDIPDFGTPLNRIAGSAEKIAGLKPGEGLTTMDAETSDHIKQSDDRAEVTREADSEVTRGDGTAKLPTELAPARVRS